MFICEKVNIEIDLFEIYKIYWKFLECGNIIDVLCF